MGSRKELSATDVSPFRRTATRSPSATTKHHPTRPTTGCSRSPLRATASLDCGTALCLGLETDTDRDGARGPGDCGRAPVCQGGAPVLNRGGLPTLLLNCALLIANKASEYRAAAVASPGLEGAAGRGCLSRVCAGAAGSSSDGRSRRSAAFSGAAPRAGRDHFRLGRGAAKMADPGVASLPSRCPGRHPAGGSSGGARRGREQHAGGPTGGAGRGGTGPEPPGREGEGRSYQRHRGTGGRRFRAVAP